MTTKKKRRRRKPVQSRPIDLGISIIYYGEHESPEVKFTGRPHGSRIRDAQRQLQLGYNKWQNQEYIREEKQRAKESELLKQKESEEAEQLIENIGEIDG